MVARNRSRSASLRNIYSIDIDRSALLARDQDASRAPAIKINKMPWNANYFPASMKHLPPLVREKAIEIANALLEEGMEEGKAIRIAIAKAKAWAARIEEG